ncbi:dihydroorotase/allantoinase [Lipingzhangella halophila]|uniref:Dihydroorotase/allantoinase n=1 Tax=Lipingzhangella halophila TaxID=1783352 RepID=A0A7W7W2F9_9ACTN|nr:amidohydrolase family protein [Lipingzhangella halophila]MBB4930734.1 dihydroorotase/allantoinase [Lipingzhangella halophila]
MPKFDLIVRSRRVVTPDGVVAGAVAVHDGRVHAIRHYGAALSGHEEADLGAAALLPGCVDVDVAVLPPASEHPGASLRERYTRAARAALRGGVTTMAVTPAPARPAITDIAAFRAHRDAARGLTPNVVFLGGISRGNPRAGIAELRTSGIVAFWCSLSDGGAPDLPATDDPGLRAAMDELATVGAPLLVHTEDAGELAAAGDGASASAPAERPARAERRGLERVIAAARASGARAHVTPFTAAECAALVAAARPLGVSVGAHTCPHYLCLPAEQVPPDSAGGEGRPPLRSAANRAALWNALLGADPVITTVGSGHRAGTGGTTLPLALSALWTAAVRRGLGLADLARWTSEQPAGLLGLRSKGAIVAGGDADLVAFCPDSEWQVPLDSGTPYAGRRLTGRVLRTWVGGAEATEDAVPDAPVTRRRRPRPAKI